MKKNDLKQLIKPLVKECIHEVLIEEGLLSNVVSEVAKGLQHNVVMETKTNTSPTLFNENLQMQRTTNNSRTQMKEHRQKLMDAIGNEAYKGVNLFEGTDPMSHPEPAKGQVDLGPAGDAGVDIGSLVGNASEIWKAMK
ncbi:hypothetical protein CMI47_17335 [Candidatus Pacearchaeota archaeon]|nr:hypothetical protein [Candidatus Pacearchaeota archaeon]|tara:strand:+ start:960 stop:1376 length:417 start_codon:yes stop_codon:yes gene_type:complete